MITLKKPESASSSSVEIGPDLRGESYRVGDVELRTHVSILVGLNTDKQTGKLASLETREDDSSWEIVKWQRDEKTSKESCYVLAFIRFKNEDQEEFDLESVGSRLVDDIDATDLENLKKITAKVGEHCLWMHEQRWYCQNS